MDLGVIAMKRYFAQARAPEMDQMQFSVIARISTFSGWGVLTPQQEIQSTYSKPCRQVELFIEIFMLIN